MAAVYTCLTRRVLQVDYGFSVNMSYHALAAGSLWFQCIPVLRRTCRKWITAAVYTYLTTRVLQVDYGCSVYLSDDTCVARRLWLQSIPV